MISATIVADSICNGNRITTMEVVFPRFILAELNTHRLFSRNSASSRAIPFEKMVKSVEENPFIPIAWQKDHKGMQGTEYITDDISIESCKSEWLDAKNNAVTQAKRLSYYSVTKQLCNRLLEPFMWHKVLITATEWDNFFDLRCPQYYFNDQEYYKSKKDLLKAHSDSNMDYATTEQWLMCNKGQSEIHMMALAEAMYDAYNESTPKELQPGEWHIPYSDNINIDSTGTTHYTDEAFGATLRSWYAAKGINDLELKISTARCARLSYQTLGDDPKIDYEADIRLHDNLLKEGHMSPFEHCAYAMDKETFNNFVKGEITGKLGDFAMGNFEYGWCNNFKGWIPYRHRLESIK